MIFISIIICIAGVICVSIMANVIRHISDNKLEIKELELEHEERKPEYNCEHSYIEISKKEVEDFHYYSLDSCDTEKYICVIQQCSKCGKLNKFKTIF